QVWFDGAQLTDFPNIDGTHEFSVTVAADGVRVIELRMAGDDNLTVWLDELRNPGPGDGRAPTYASERQACATALVDALGSAAYRRPLTKSEKQQLTAVYQAAADDSGFADGVRTLVQAVLTSPYFLYLVEIGEPVEGSPNYFRL